MNKCRLATSHLMMIGIISFVILVLVSLYLKLNLAVVVMLVITVLILLSLLYAQKRHYELGAEQALGDNQSSHMDSLLEQMPIGILTLTPELDGLVWYNPYAELIFTKENGEFDESFVLELVATKKEALASPSFELGDKKFIIHIDVDRAVCYVYEQLSLPKISGELSDFSPVIGTIFLDNYDEVTANLTDAETSQINIFVANFIAEFAERYQIFYRRVDMDRFYFFTDYAILSQLISNKFEMLEQFRTEAREKELPLTLSMGIAFGDHNHYELGQIAQKNLNLALVRGGDQVVVKENDDHKDFMYFGGGSAATVKRSRTRTRAMMTAISDKIKMADAVFVVGHRQLDLDALGATVGMQHFASRLIDKSYAVYDPNQMSPDIAKAIARLEEDGNTTLLSVDRALSMVTQRSLLIMVDHSKLALTLSDELYRLFREVVIVDHHRRDDDFPENAMLSFIESGASSACELVTELIQFQAAKPKLSRLQASIIMSGIILDTNKFTTRVTSRTFDVASYLRSLGSDSNEINTILATDFEEYRQVNALVLKGQRVFDNIIIAIGDEAETYTNVIASKAANTLLTMAGIEASFVITRNVTFDVAVSARSRGNINVQRVMEKMGGGGHFNLAACQLVDSSLEDAYTLIVSELEEVLKEGN